MSRNQPEKDLGRLLNVQDSTASKQAHVTPILIHAKVVDNEDPLNSERIRVKIEGIDDNTPMDNLPWCISSMPSFFFCLPQVDEHVIIYLTNPWNPKLGRLYFGPIAAGDHTEQSYIDSMNDFGLVTRKVK